MHLKTLYLGVYGRGANNTASLNLSCPALILYQHKLFFRVKWPFGLRVMQKLCHCLWFSSLSPSSQCFWADWPKFYFFMLLLKTHATSIGLISLNTLEKKNSTRDVLLVVIPGTCGPWHVMCFSLFTVTSIHSIRKRTRNRNLETRLKVIEDLNLKRQRNQFDKSKLWGKGVDKIFLRRNWLLNYLKVILKLLLGNMFCQKTYILILLLMMK